MAIMRFSTAAAHAMLDGTGGLVGYLNAGASAPNIKFYNGAMVATGDTALGAQVLLATLAFTDPIQAGVSANRAVVFAAITGANAVFDGTGTFAIVFNGNGDRAWACDVTLTAGTGAIKLGNTIFTNGLPVGLTESSISIPITIAT